MHPWPLLLLALAVASPSAAAEEEATIKRPDWVVRPSGADLMAIIPPSLLNKLDSGAAATVMCKVNAQLKLDACRVLSEFPDRQGIGGALANGAKRYRLKPKSLDGQDVVGGTVKIALRLATSARANAGFIQKPAWAKTPTTTQLAAAFPQGHDDVDSAHFSFMCSAANTGRLTNCIMVSAEPESADFRRAARSLPDLFELAIDTSAEPLPSRATLNLDIELPNPSKPIAPPKIDKPTWWTFPNAEAVQAAFPAKAREAKVATGRAILDCTTDHDGHLVNCKAEEQGTQSLGFDEAALKVVDKMRIVPWIAPGVPVDGAKLRFLMRMDDAPPPTSATTPN